MLRNYKTGVAAGERGVRPYIMYRGVMFGLNAFKYRRELENDGQSSILAHIGRRVKA